MNIMMDPNKLLLGLIWQ